ncbi:unnamed protein product [Aureobasidium mustum]|uniref:DNA-binding protein RAP1 n=1 Tax=Aureobasidium mustum TaxID=2773714 RepID=A0A9N8PML4_9PEZI|nr:unnamed protein product [Aureobasidium mustum]
MPPAIVYTDMADSANVQGSVFADKNFFIVQRVPQRSHYISLVESNGGRVVKLEAQADYLIADHMRHDAPAGSLSYKFIEESIKQGEMPEDESAFLAGRRKSANPVTTAVASSSKKSTRTPFTDDDDKLLYKWVHNAKEEGLATQGNSLYQVLAAHNPRHTYHSWRDRYLKVLSTRPPPGWESYPDEDLPAIDSSIADIPSTAVPRSTAVNRSASRSASATKSPSKAQDDEELEAWVRKQAGLGASINGNAIYKELEKRNPRHTFHSWRDRWVRHLSLRDPVDEEEEDLEDAHPVDEDHASARRDPSPEPPISKPPVKRSTFRVPPGASASADSSKNTTPRPDIPRTTVSTKEKATKPTSQAAAQSPVAAREQLAMDTVSPPTATASRPAVTSKNQANTPMARTRNLSSPVMSQQPQPQQIHTQASRPPIRHRAIQADFGAQFHDDSTFTEEDSKYLLRMALEIQNVCVGRYQESWINFANHNKNHTAQDLEHLKEQGDKGWIEFWEHQGQPITTLPCIEQNITSDIRPAPIRATEPEGESLPHASGAGSTEQNEEVVDTVNHAVKARRNGSSESVKRKQQISVDGVEEQPPSKRRRTATPPSVPSKILTPAETTEQLDADEVVSIASKDTPSPSYHSDEEEETSEDQAAEQLRREMAENKDSRHQLTRANLARIQAENGSSEEKRGLDIEEDDEEEDQADFATYLASMLPPGMKDKALETIETNDHQMEQDDEGEEDEDDEDIIMSNQDEAALNYNPADREIDPDLDNPSYQSSAEFRANNSNIHLEAPPTQAWDVSSAPSQSQPQRQRLSTQAIYDAETQAFDAEIPSPPPGNVEETQSYATANTDSQILSTDEFWPWIDAQTAAGYIEEDVISALRQTSFNPKLASVVLEAKARGAELDIAGVWTEEEDKMVEGRDGRALRKLQNKHGAVRVDKRLQFLSDWRNDEKIANQGE